MGNICFLVLLFSIVYRPELFIDQTPTVIHHRVIQNTGNHYKHRWVSTPFTIEHLFPLLTTNIHYQTQRHYHTI